MTIAAVLTEHQQAMGHRDMKVHCWCGWSGARVDGAFIAHQAEALTAAGYQPEVIVEWGVAHENGVVHRTYSTRNEAHDFIEGMAEVGYPMTIARREYTPAIHTAWDVYCCIFGPNCPNCVPHRCDDYCNSCEGS